MNLSMTNKNNQTECKTVKMITINPEYSKLVNPLSALEYEIVKNFLNEKDLYLPKIINSKNVFLESHNRYSTCKEFKIETQFEVKNFENPLDEKELIIETNLKKRPLNEFQKYKLIYSFEKIDQEEETCKECFMKEDLKKKDL
jgi:hypothetical protein